MLKSLQKSKILAVLLFVIVTLQSGHAFQTVIPNVGSLVYIPTVLGLLWLIISIQANKLNKTTILLGLFVMMIGFTFVAYSGSNFSYYLSLFCMIVAAYAISELYSFEKLILWYIRVMTVVSIVALIGYVLLNTTNLLSALPTVKNLNNVTYRTAIIYNYIPDIPERNCGMFWEPGLFATHLTFSLLFEMMAKEHPNTLRLILFSVCIFTANSSAGFVLWFFCLILFFIRKDHKGALGLFKNVFSIIMIVLAIIVIANFDTILSKTALGENEYFQKLSSKSVSSSTRNNALAHNMEIFLKHPVLGAGISYVTSHMAYVADTSTSTFLMSIFGILGALYTIYWIYGIAKMKRINILSKIVIAVIILIIINKEPHHQLLFTWILLFYFIKLDSFPCVKAKSKNNGDEA